MTEGAARIGERRLVRTLWIEPGALDAGDIAFKIGDGGKQRRPAFERSVVRLAVVDRRVIAQGGPVEPSGDATGAQIGFGRCARNGRPARTGDAPLRKSRSLLVAYDRDSSAMGRGTWQGEKAARFVHRFAKTVQVAVEADQIQEARPAGLCYGRARCCVPKIRVRAPKRR